MAAVALACGVSIDQGSRVQDRGGGVGQRPLPLRPAADQHLPPARGA